MIRINACFEVSPENRSEVVSVLRELVTKSRQEAGCVAYHLFEEDEDDTLLLMFETWRDEAAVAAHNASKHFTTYIPALQEVCKSVTVERFDF